jgi:hypothetical protein
MYAAAIMVAVDIDNVADMQGVERGRIRIILSYRKSAHLHFYGTNSNESQNFEFTTKIDIYTK